MGEWLICVVIGLFAGVLAGMFGIGGGVVIVPALILALGYSVTTASGTSLAALLLPVGIFAVIKYYKSGYMSIKTSLWIALGLLSGVYSGSQIALSLPKEVMMPLYGVFLLYVSWNFINPMELFNLKKNKPETDKHYNENVHFIWLYLLGIGAGILSGLFGIGGGLVITPFLMGVMGFDPKKAIGTSLGALLLPVGLPGVIVYYNNGTLDLPIAGAVALGLLMGAVVGAKITIAMPAKKIKLVYGFFVLIMAFYFIFQKFINDLLY